MSDIPDRVKKIVVEHLGVEKEKVVESASFVDDLGADSLDTVELVMAFEEEFNIEIPDDIAEKITTIKEAMSNLQLSSKKILCVLNRKKELVGVLNDGDIRRSILKNLSYKTQVKDIMNKKPIVSGVNYSKNSLKKFMMNNRAKIKKLNYLYKST